jgi:hypothetical protein
LPDRGGAAQDAGMKRIAVLWALAFGFLPLARCQVNGVTAELSLAQNELLPDEDMQLKLRVENRSGQELHLGQDDHWISFSVTGENNTVVAQTGESAVSNSFTLSSGQVSTCTFNLTPYFNFRAPGHYSVSATFKVPQWNQAVTCKPTTFTIVNGTRLANIPDVQVGVPLPPDVTNTAPEVRRYFLEKVDLESGSRLYFQLTDGSGARTLRVFPIGRWLSFSAPEVQIDRYSNLHVLHQTYAQTFNYCVINPLGQILDRQTYEYTATRPELTLSNGTVLVVGGSRRPATNDIPPSLPAAAGTNH